VVESVSGADACRSAARLRRDRPMFRTRGRAFKRGVWDHPASCWEVARNDGSSQSSPVCERECGRRRAAVTATGPLRVPALWAPAGWLIPLRTGYPGALARLGARPRSPGRFSEMPGWLLQKLQTAFCKMDYWQFGRTECHLAGSGLGMSIPFANGDEHASRQPCDQADE
jgi:hypothetical protein